MRVIRDAQTSIFDYYSPHPVGQQLEALSDMLDDQPSLLAAVEQDLSDDCATRTGANGLSLESVFRCLLLKQILQVSYEQLSFHLSDSATYRTFARLQPDQFPSRSGLHGAIRRIRAASLELANDLLVGNLIDSGTIDIRNLRVDSTVTESNIAPPSDSSLLEDGVRVLSRLLSKSKDETGVRLRFTDQRRLAKSLSYKIFLAKKPEKDELYPKLLSCATRVIRQTGRALDKVRIEGSKNEFTQRWIEKVVHFRGLLLHVIDQTQRRVYGEETVPADEKLVSLFEPHTSIIVKGERDVLYGHKINLATQANGFIVYLNIEQGNPADSNLYHPVLQGCQHTYGQLPDMVVADGCYASQENVKRAQELGVGKNVFSKPVGLSLSDMRIKRKTLERQRNFRAGVEGNISELKRAFGVGKAMWKGQEGFNAFVWASTLCYNLIRSVRFSSA
jgi:IS5 family transposase